MAIDTAVIKRKLRCAVYTRKSSEEGLEQEFNSLDAQREPARPMLPARRPRAGSWCWTTTTDGGFSAGP